LTLTILFIFSVILLTTTSFKSCFIVVNVLNRLSYCCYWKRSTLFCVVVFIG